MLYKGKKKSSWVLKGELKFKKLYTDDAILFCQYCETEKGEIFETDFQGVYIGKLASYLGQYKLNP